MGRIFLNIFSLTFVACAVITYDISTHGSLESSNVGRLLKQAGLLIYIKPYYTIIEEQTLFAYKWGKKNFPYKEYNDLRNKTLELSSSVGNKVLIFSKDAFTITKTVSVKSYNWVAERIPPDFSEQVFRILSKSYDVVCNYAKISYDVSIQYAQKTQKWLAENLTKEKLTWENAEKSFFDLAHMIKIYYMHAAGWVGRKVECLMSA